MEDEDLDNMFDTILGKTFDGSILPFQEGDDLWLPRGAEPLLIKDMKDSHLVNSINYWKRTHHPGWDILDPIKDEKLQRKFSNALAHVASMIKFPKYKVLWEEAKKRGLVK